MGDVITWNAGHAACRVLVDHLGSAPNGHAVHSRSSPSPTAAGQPGIDSTYHSRGGSLHVDAL
jgi:hypothetical protein